MDAIEFVKEFGIKHATGFFKWADKHRKIGDTRDLELSTSDGNISFIELKQIVEAFELVEVGLPELKKLMFSESKDLDYVKNWVLTVSEKLLTEKGIKLKKAIELVEKCQ